MPFPKTYRTNAGWALSIGAILGLISSLRNEERAIIALAVVGVVGLLWIENPERGSRLSVG